LPVEILVAEGQVLAFHLFCLSILALLLCGCGEPEAATPLLRCYVFDEPSGAFEQAAADCSAAAEGRYQITLVPAIALLYLRGFGVTILHREDR
jgi:hypothetical protein